MTYPTPLDPFEKSLRRAAEEIHPRPAFTAGLRAKLAEQQAQRQANPPRFGWARPVLAQGGVLALLVGLVALAVLLTPQLLPDPRPGQGGDPTGIAQPPTSTPLPGDTLPIDGPGLPEDRLPTGALARLGRGSILAMDSAADGRVAIGSTLGLCLYNTGFTTDWCAPFGLAYQINWLLFNPQGDRLALALGGEGEGQLIVLDAASGSILATYPLPGVSPGLGFNDAAIAWDPSGAPRLALPGRGGTLLVWDWQSGALAWGPLDLTEPAGAGPFTVPNWALDWAIDEQGQSLLAVGGPGGLLLLDGATGQERLRLSSTSGAAPVSDIRALDLSADGRWLALGTSGGPLALRLEAGQIAEQKMWETGWIPMQIAVGPRALGYPLAAQVKQGVQITPLESAVADEREEPAGEEPAGEEPAGEEPVVISAGYGPLVWNAAGTSLFYVWAEGMWGSYQNGQGSSIPSLYSVWPARIAWTSSGRLLSLQGQALVYWDPRSSSIDETGTFNSPNYTLLAVSQDGSHTAHSVEGEAAIDVRDFASNQRAAWLEPADASAWAAFSADGSRLVTVDYSGRLNVWDTTTGGPVQRQAARQILVTPVQSQLDGLTLSPDGRTVALAWSGGGASYLDLLDLERGEKLHALPITSTVTALAFSPDGRTLAEASAGQVTLWDVASGQKTQTMGPQAYNNASDAVWQEPTGTIAALAWSPDGQTLATGGGLVTLWDVAQGQPLRAFGGHRGLVSALAYRADGLVLASGSIDGTILLWDTGAGSLPPLDPQPTATPLDAAPVEASPTPPGALPFEATPTPLPVSGPVVPEAYVMEGESLDGRWHASVRHALQSQDGQPVERVHELTVQGPDGQNYTYTTREDLRLPGSQPITWSAFKWWPVAPDALYWYEIVEPTTACGPLYHTHLRRMDLTTGQVETVAGFGPEWLGTLALAYDTPQMAFLDGNQLVVRDLVDGSERRMDFTPAGPGQTRVMMFDILPLENGVLLAQRVSADLAAPTEPGAPTVNCYRRPGPQKVILFDLRRNRIQERVLPEELNFRGYEVNGFIIASDASESLYRVHLESGKVEPQPPFPSDAAGQALWDFLHALAAGADDPAAYAQAAALYGGSWDELAGLNPDLSPGDHAALLARACQENGYTCRPIRQFQTAGERDGFLFEVDYDNGQRGTFRVKQNEAGVWLVMVLPEKEGD